MQSIAVKITVLFPQLNFTFINTQPGGGDGLAVVSAAHADRVDANPADAAAAGLAAAAAGGHQAPPELFRHVSRAQ